MLEEEGAEGVDDRSWVLVEGAAALWRVLGATISSVAEVSKRAGDAEGDVESRADQQRGISITPSS